MPLHSAIPSRTHAARLSPAYSFILLFRRYPVLKRIVFAVLTTLIILTAFSPVLLTYVSPMEDASYNLSIIGEDGQPWQGNKGWTVYTCTEGAVKELTPTGYGAYYGLDYPGQTFYFSRRLTEELDSPTLRIGAANRTFSVFLDDELIYTDCPELDNRIGYLTLPMLEADRFEPLVVSLPTGYAGKTLTIAQSTYAVGSDAPGSDADVFPADITLYCGYAYESGLIAQTARHIIPAALLFSAGVFMLIIFIWNASSGRLDASLPLLAQLSFALMLREIVQAPFFFYYFGVLPIDLTALCLYVSASLLLGLLVCPLSGWLRWTMLTVALLQFGVVCYNTVCEYQGTVHALLCAKATVFALLLAFLLALLAWRRGSAFHRQFCLLVLTGGAIAALFLLLGPRFFPELQRADGAQATALSLLLVLMPLCFVAALIALAVQTVKGLVRRRSETSILLAKEQFARASYDTLRAQTEQTMELRHDMRHHLTVLRALLRKQDYTQAQEYVDGLISQSRSITPVVRCGNQMLDIILNGTLAAALRDKVRVEVVHAAAPASLPLSDPDLASLVMNVMENAVHAACSSPVGERFIRLDIRTKDNFLVFCCCNSAPLSEPAAGSKKSGPLSSHGYGLKIIDRILKQAGGFCRIETGRGQFQLTFGLPLRCPEKTAAHKMQQG